MDYQHKDIRTFWRGWTEAIRKHPGRTLGLLLATISFGAALVVAVAFLSAVGTKLADTREQVSHLTNQFSELKIDVRQAVNMKQEISQTVNVITKVEKEIANIKETINQLYSRLRTEVFRPSQAEGRFCGWADSNKASWVALRLQGSPVQGSVQGIWDNRPLYPTSMRTFENVLVYVFKGAEIQTNKVFSISYMVDPDKTNIFRRVEVRDDALYMDSLRVERTALP